MCKTNSLKKRTIIEKLPTKYCNQSIFCPFVRVRTGPRCTMCGQVLTVGQRLSYVCCYLTVRLSPLAQVMRVAVLGPWLVIRKKLREMMHWGQPGTGAIKPRHWSLPEDLAANEGKRLAETLITLEQREVTRSRGHSPSWKAQNRWRWLWCRYCRPCHLSTCDFGNECVLESSDLCLHIYRYARAMFVWEREKERELKEKKKKALFSRFDGTTTATIIFFLYLWLRKHFSKEPMPSTWSLNTTLLEDSQSSVWSRPLHFVFVCLPIVFRLLFFLRERLCILKVLCLMSLRPPCLWFTFQNKIF